MLKYPEDYEKFENVKIEIPITLLNALIGAIHDCVDSEDAIREEAIEYLEAAQKKEESPGTIDNTDYEAACIIYDEYICDLDPIAPKNFRTWCEQRLNQADKTPGIS